MRRRHSTLIQAYSYLRVSGRAQVDGDGFPRQREAIDTFCNAAGIEIVQEFAEEAISGRTEWDGRPAWLEMMLAIDGIDTIIIERLDRLARDLMVQEHIIADLKKRGITLISTMEPDLCTDDPSRKLLRQIMGAIAEYDRAMIVLKLRGARKRMKAATGRCEGRKPYGTRTDEVHVMAAIADLRRQGLTTAAIAERINQEGCRTRYGQEWRGTTIAKILRRSRPAAPAAVANE